MHVDELFYKRYDGLLQITSDVTSKFVLYCIVLNGIVLWRKLTINTLCREIVL